MRLSTFILKNKESILQAWENFARTIEPPALTMDDDDLRDHVALMLDTIVIDLNTPQTAAEQAQKSKGLAPSEQQESYAQIHASARLASGYTINQLVAEYRALRASVLRLWERNSMEELATDTDDMTRFNEAIDQALAESVARFAELTIANALFEKQRLDAILEVAPVGIGIADTSGKLVLLNVENQRISGDHPVANSLVELDRWKGWWADGSPKHGEPVHPDEWALVRALQVGESARDIVEIEPFGAPGERRTILLHAEPIRDAIENVIGSVMAQMDITAQVNMEAALRESEAKFKTIANAMPQMVWSTLPNGYHDYFNKQWYDFTGTQEGSTDGTDYWNLMFHSDDRERATRNWSRCLATGEIYEIQYRLRHHSGIYRWTLGRALPVRSESGEIIRWMGTCTDIHDQKLAEELLKEESQRKDEFLAMLAHELRNPLAPISTAAQIIRIATGDATKVRSAADIISRQVKHMTNLVDDLLDVSRITRGLVELQSEILDLKQVVVSAIEQARPLVESRGHEQRLVMTSLPAFVKGDKTRLVQVVANLLNNASKYTPQGGGITIALDVNDSAASIDVSDNGSGIAPALLPHIFDLFTQGERTPDRIQGGLGLGLSLVKNIILLHGGTVTAHSDGPGKGSRFSISIPLEMDACKPVDALVSADALIAAAVPLRIMIVDDNVDAAQLLATLLESFGHQVSVAESSACTLSSPFKAEIQVFILDIGLPGMDGFALARCLREDASTRDALLIALTGYGQAHDRVLTKAAGFEHHFVKPIDIDALVSVFNDAQRVSPCASAAFSK